MTRISEFVIGQVAELKQQIGERELARFVELTGDDNPIHTDESYAEKTQFKTRVMHGMLGASFISTIIGKHLPGEGALWVSQKLDFHSPVFVNDELLVRAEVVEIHSAQSLLTLKITISNQLNQLVTSGESKVKVLERTSEHLIEASAHKGTVIVTGGSSGIGAAVASALAVAGYNIGIVYRDNRAGAEATLQRVEALGSKACIFQADVASQKQVEKAFKAFYTTLGPVSGLVNAAAPRIIEKSLDQLDWEDIELQFNPQVRGAFYCIKALLPYVSSSGASVVNIGSIVAESSTPDRWLAYAIAKQGVHGLTKVLVEPLGLKNIRINTVAPGLTNTRFVASIPERTKLMVEAQTPLRRLAEPEDVADAVAFLIGSSAKHITGTTLRVNGGKTLL